MHRDNMTDFTNQQQLLLFLYQHFDTYIKKKYPIACQRGCSLCCTQDVILTTLEGYQIVKQITENADILDLNLLATTDSARFRPRYTINDLAEACLNHREPPDEGPGPDLKVCPLLQNNLCPIYDVRPFICRSFLSQQSCQSEEQAEIPSGLASIIAACQQIIEHLDVNGYYGNLADIIHLLNTGNNHRTYIDGNRPDAKGIAQTKPLPGFLIPPEDAVEVREFLMPLFYSKVNGVPFYKQLNSICPMPVHRGESSQQR